MENNFGIGRDAIKDLPEAQAELERATSAWARYETRRDILATLIESATTATNLVQTIVTTDSRDVGLHWKNLSRVRADLERDGHTILGIYGALGKRRENA